VAEAIFARVVLDTSVLLGARRKELIAAADLGYFRGFWSVWIATELARVRTEWIALRAARDGADQPDLRDRLERSRTRVNAEVAVLSKVFSLVDYLAASDADTSWLGDEDDRPIVQTAIAAGIPCTLVTDNWRDFPWGEVRNGVLILGGDRFLDALYQAFPDAPTAVAAYLGRR
jgi:hypothetical protein